MLTPIARCGKGTVSHRLEQAKCRGKHELTFLSADSGPEWKHPFQRERLRLQRPSRSCHCVSLYPRSGAIHILTVLQLLADRFVFEGLI